MAPYCLYIISKGCAFVNSFLSFCSDLPDLSFREKRFAFLSGACYNILYVRAVFIITGFNMLRGEGFDSLICGAREVI